MTSHRIFASAKPTYQRLTLLPQDPREAKVLEELQRRRKEKARG